MLRRVCTPARRAAFSGVRWNSSGTPQPAWDTADSAVSTYGASAPGKAGWTGYEYPGPEGGTSRKEVLGALANYDKLTRRQKQQFHYRSQGYTRWFGATVTRGGPILGMFAVLYWHFVDVIWILLYFMVYRVAAN